MQHTIDPALAPCYYNATREQWLSFRKYHRPEIMYDVVPGPLQRLRESDIVSVAGLAVASLGQEYCRIGAVHSTKRQKMKLSGIVEISDLASSRTVAATNGARKTEQVENAPGHYVVEVEVRDYLAWRTTCTCNAVRRPSVPCVHATALLYQWLAYPATFLTLHMPTPPLQPTKQAIPLAEDIALTEQSPNVARQSHKTGSPSRTVVQRISQPHSTVSEILAQLGLSELRGIAREYDVATTGLNKQQLQDALSETLKQPEAIRRVVGTLEKPQRQLLAALALAGGSMSDDDLRSLFERFSLGTPNHLQSILIALQNRALIFHTSLNSALQLPIGLSGVLHDVGWVVPAEVHGALRVTLPITPYDMQAGSEKNGAVTNIEQTAPFSLLADMLLIARLLDGQRFERELDTSLQRSAAGIRPTYNLNSADGAIAVPPPDDLPASALLKLLQDTLFSTPAYGRFAIGLLRLADILYKDDATTATLHILPNAARLLLGPARTEVASELFAHWLARPSYDELFALQEDGLRLRCRAASLGTPVLRQGELEVENSEARQTLVALLTQAPLQQWISFPAFARFVYRLNPFFLQKRQHLYSSPHWWIEQEDGRILRPTQLNDWLRVEGRYLARLVEGPLHWWGASDLGYADDGHLLAFRLTPLAGMLLNETPMNEHDEQGQAAQARSTLQISTTGDLLIACNTTQWPLIELVEGFAEVAGVRSGKLCYRLSPKSLSEALGHGKNPTVLLEMLRSAMDEQSDALPGWEPNLLTQLEQRIANYGRVRLYTDCVLLEVADTLVVRELSATTSFDKYIVQAVSPTLMLLKKQGTERLIEELKRRGQVPLVHEEERYGAE